LPFEPTAFSRGPANRLEFSTPGPPTRPATSVKQCT
jgi:hypothetical protein